MKEMNLLEAAKAVVKEAREYDGMGDTWLNAIKSLDIAAKEEEIRLLGIELAFSKKTYR